jgi:hypothetical protein
MKTRALNLVSSPDQAGLKTLEKPRFLTPTPKVMTPPIPTLRESTTPHIRTLVGTCSTRACPATAAIPLFPLRPTSTEPLMRSHHDSPQPTAFWTAVALYRFPIVFQLLTHSKAHPQTSMLCVFAPVPATRRSLHEAPSALCPRHFSFKKARECAYLRISREAIALLAIGHRLLAFPPLPNLKTLNLQTT